MSGKRPKVDPAAVADFERRAREATAAYLRELDPDITDAEIAERLGHARGSILAARPHVPRGQVFPTVKTTHEPATREGAANVNRWLGAGGRPSEQPRRIEAIVNADLIRAQPNTSDEEDQQWVDAVTEPLNWIGERLPDLERRERGGQPPIH